MILSALGARIRSQREKRGLKQNDLASALRISPQAVSKWERGENAPDIAVIIPLAKLLGVSADWLLGGQTPDRDVFEATVLACGVQGARQRSEEMQPRDFAAWANAFCFQITEVVLRNGGVPIKYMGPGILCFFAGAEHPARGIRAGLEAKAISAEPLKIGVSSGEVYLGAIGHPDYSRPDIMGETVSIALLATEWAASNTKSGIVACSSTTKDLTEPFSIGKEQSVVFPGISHRIGVCEVI